MANIIKRRGTKTLDLSFIKEGKVDKDLIKDSQDDERPATKEEALRLLRQSQERNASDSHYTSALEREINHIKYG